jgi:hypothetical protein
MRGGEDSYARHRNSGSLAFSVTQAAYRQTKLLILLHVAELTALDQLRVGRELQ